MATESVRIFHIEAPSPLDLLSGIAEGPVLQAIAPLIGHSIHRQTVLSELEFATALRFLGEIGRFEDGENTRTLVLHISAHGYGEGKGLSFGADNVPWRRLTELLQPFVKIGQRYKGYRVMVLSACNAHEQKMTTALARNASIHKNLIPPKYLFCSEQEVPWQDAAVGWTLFYHQMPNVQLDEPDTVRNMLKLIASLNIHIRYFRWDSNEATYKRFPKGKLRAQRA